MGDEAKNRYPYTEAAKRRDEDAESVARGEPVERFRVVEVNEYLGREEEWSGLSLGEAAMRVDEQTGVGADVVLADFDEDCTMCGGSGAKGVFHDIVCNGCHGTGKRRDPWEWKDDETGREVVLRLEVEPDPDRKRRAGE